MPKTSVTLGQVERFEDTTLSESLASCYNGLNNNEVNGQLRGPITVLFYGPAVQENRETVAKAFRDSGLFQSVQVR